MKLFLSVIEGPFSGRRFVFEGHDTFLVGRVKDAHLRLPFDDPFFSRRHFVLEANPPRCRLMDLKSRNGTFVNGERVSSAEVRHGDLIKAGHTIFRVSVEGVEPEKRVTMDDATVAPQAGVPVIPGYVVGEEIGRGAMGVVYRGRCLDDGSAVAVKTIVPAAGVSPKYVERFVREAKILERLRHPNVVAFREAGSVGGTIYLVMELVNGPDVRKVLGEKGPLPVAMAVRIACQVLSGLQYAHDAGFVHRDVKPANLLVQTVEGKRVTKVADFGLARAYQTSRLSGVTLQGEAGGTPAFMPPEQVTNFRDVGPAADQYSAAATLYALLTNATVHDLPRGLEQQLIHITTEEPVPIRSRRADVPEGLAKAIHKALSREPEERYADAGALRAELKRWA